MVRQIHIEDVKVGIKESLLGSSATWKTHYWTHRRDVETAEWWQSWNYGKYLQWCQASIKKLLPILRVHVKHSELLQSSFFWKCHGSSELWKMFIHSFSFPSLLENTSGVCVEQWKDLPRLNVTPITDLQSKTKFEKLISPSMYSTIQKKMWT